MLKIVLLLCFCLVALNGCSNLTSQTTLPVTSDFSPEASADTKIFNTTGPPQIEDKNGYFLLPPINVSL